MKTIILILITLLSFNSNADLAFNIKLPFKNIHIHTIEDDGGSIEAPCFNDCDGSTTDEDDGGSIEAPCFGARCED